MVKGNKIKMVIDEKFENVCNEHTLWVDYKNIVKILNVGSRIYVDDGLISLIVEAKGESFYFDDKFSFVWVTIHDSLFCW